MLKPQLHHQLNSTTTKTRFLLPKSFLGSRNEVARLLFKSLSVSRFNKGRTFTVRAASSKPSTDSISTKANDGSSHELQRIEVKAVVTVKETIGGKLTSLGMERGLDDIQDLLGKTLLLELVSVELDPETKVEKATVQGFAHRTGKTNGDVKYEADFEIPEDFGEVGAVLVENEHHKEMFLQDIVIEGFPQGPVHVPCASWVHSKFHDSQKRVFFTSKPYLPSQTPIGIKRLRERELALLRGNGQGERKMGDRIYDYDVYNDLGDPDSTFKLERPVLGGGEHPYPRRCRTGRPRCETDSLFGKRKGSFYVPRDEAFSEVKQLTFSAKTLYLLFNALVPSLGNVIGDADIGFPYFTAIDSLFNEGITMPPLSREGFWQTMLPRLFKALTDGKDVLRFETPQTTERDKFFWLRDEELLARPRYF